jgi:putative CocE/NonD family hydrolase
VLQLGFIVTWLLGSLGNADIQRLRLTDPALASRLTDAFDELASKPEQAFQHPTAHLVEVLGDVSPYARCWFAHRQRDEYWHALSASDRLDRIAVPALHIAGWHDIFLMATLRTFGRLRASAATDRARTGQRLVIGPWTHQTTGSAAGTAVYGPAAAMATPDSTRLHLEFFAACLRGEDPPGSTVRFYVMGADRWRDEDEWPPSRVQTATWYLHHDGTLAVAPASHAVATTGFTHDPGDPAPTVAGATLLPGDDIALVAGPRVRWAAQHHVGTVVWTSAPLAEDTELCGSLRAVLWVSAEAPDADVYVALSAVDQAGNAMHVSDGIQRLSFRDSTDRPSPLAKGEVVCVDIAIGATSMVLPAGTRIRAEVTGSCFPRFEQHPDHLHPVRQFVHHGAARPSHLCLQVL